MLAVSTNENGIKVLANADGLRLLHSIENHAVDASGMASGNAVKVYCSIRYMKVTKKLDL